MAGSVRNAGSIITRKDTAPGNTRPISVWIDRYKNEIGNALPSMLTPERFIRMCHNALSTNPDLMRCTEKSFIGAMLNAAALGIEPNTPLGQGYLIPRWNSKNSAMECSFQLGYKGLISLVYRSGEVTTIDAHEVYANDFFEYEYGLNPRLEHKPTMNDRGEIIAYYAIWKGKSGGQGFAVMSKQDVMKHALQFSQSKKKDKSGDYYLVGAWSSNFDGMARKTVLAQALRYAPLSTELASKIAQDNSVKNFEPTQQNFNISDAPNLMYEDIPGEIEPEREAIGTGTLEEPENGAAAADTAEIAAE